MRVGILGYGNLGRGIECAIRQNDDVELKAVFTRRQPDSFVVEVQQIFQNRHLNMLNISM